MIEQSIANEDCIDKYNQHIRYLDPLVVGVLHLVAHGIEHVVSSLGKEPADHQKEGHLQHDLVGGLREVWNLIIVVRDAELECDELPCQS